MRLVINVTTADGTQTAVILPPDIMRWEEKTGGKLADLQARISMSALAFLAWASLTRQDLVKGPFQAWADELVDLEPVAQEAPVPSNGDN